MGDIHPYRLKISQLRALVAIADLGTFSDAALHLELSQSAVSHAIATLEEALGCVLLHRTRQGAVLTPLGEMVTAKARTVLQALEAISKHAQQARGLQQGQVRLAGFRSVGTHILPEVIRQFRTRYPSIQVKLNEFHHYHQVETEVRQGRADIGFTYLPTSADFEVWELLRDLYVLILPPHESPEAFPATWKALSQHPLILYPPGDACRDLIQKYFTQAGLSLTPAYEVREDSTILSMVQRGLGATIIARLAAEPIPPDLSLGQLPVPMERIIGMIQLAGALQPPPVYAFKETLKTVWQQQHAALSRDLDLTSVPQGASPPYPLQAQFLSTTQK